MHNISKLPLYKKAQETSSLHYAIYHHRNQLRKGGEAYIIHPLNVLSKIRTLNLSSDIEDVAILHDIYEDCDVSVAEFEKRFGKTISFYVSCLSKDAKSCFSRDKKGHQKRLQAYLKKLEIGFKKEPRLMFVKIADQLDNIQSIFVFPRRKYFRILNELKDFYFPLYNKYAHELSPSLKICFDELYDQLVSKTKQYLNQSKSYIYRKYFKNIIINRWHKIKNCLSNTAFGYRILKISHN